jgi:four helix bundle protein
VRETGNGKQEARMARPHENPEAWRESMILVKSVCATTRSFPEEELFGLRTQTRRAAVSIPSNIAEGAGPSSRKEFARFLNVAKDSLSELETRRLISAAPGFMKRDREAFQHAGHPAGLLTGPQNKAANGKQEFSISHCLFLFTDDRLPISCSLFPVS